MFRSDHKASNSKSRRVPVAVVTDPAAQGESGEYISVTRVDGDGVTYGRGAWSFPDAASFLACAESMLEDARELSAKTAAGNGQQSKRSSITGK